MHLTRNQGRTKGGIEVDHLLRAFINRMLLCVCWE